MIFIKSFLLLCISIILSSCVSNIDLSPLLKSENYLIVETTVGDSAENAKSDAVDLITQNIYNKIVKNKIVSSNNLQNIFSKNLKLKTVEYFKNIMFSDTKKLGDNKYKISAGLSKKAILNTISCLQSNFNPRLINSSTDEELNLEYTKTIFLITLLVYSSDNGIDYNKTDLEKLINYLKTLHFKIYNGAQVTFTINPKLKATISILNKEYKPDEIIYLEPGSYYYTVYNNTYKTITNFIILRNKDVANVDVYLQKIMKSFIKLKVNIYAVNNSSIIELIRPSLGNILNKYQLIESNFSNSSIDIHLLELSSVEIDNKYYYNLPIEITLNKKNKVVVSKIFNITYVNSNSNVYAETSLITQSLDNFISQITYSNNLSYIK